LKSSFQTRHKFTAKDFGENCHGQKKLIFGMKPLAVIGFESARRNYAVDAALM